MSFVDISAIGVGTIGPIIGDIAGPYANIYSVERQIGGILPDVVVREVLSDTYTITNHAVEAGTPISDHYNRSSRVVELSIGFSDCTGGDGYSVQVFQAFRALAAQRQTFTIDTGKCSYDSMLLGDVNTVTDPESETSLIMTIRAQEVIITQTSGGGSSDPAMGSNANQADPQTTGSSTNAGQQNAAPLPYFASGAATTSSLTAAQTSSGGTANLPFFASGTAPAL